MAGKHYFCLNEVPKLTSSRRDKTALNHHNCPNVATGGRQKQTLALECSYKYKQFEQTETKFPE